jgi:hypothetical protein
MGTIWAHQWGLGTMNLTDYANHKASWETRRTLTGSF